MSDRDEGLVLQAVNLASEEAVLALDEVGFDDDGLWIAEGELPDDDVQWAVPKCPNPTKWKLSRQARTKGSFRPVSGALSAKAAPMTYTFTVSRTISFSATVSASVGVSIPGIEAQTGLSLQTSVTVSAGESVQFTVPKGKAMALFAGCGYIVRDFHRVVYGSAMCNRVDQTARVASPWMKILEVRLV